MISALPDVKRITITPEDEFMVLACDGIWNSLSSEEVVEFVRNRIHRGETKMSTICEEVNQPPTICISISYLNFVFSSILAFYGMFGTRYGWRWHWLRQHDSRYRTIQTGIGGQIRNDCVRCQ